MAAFSISGTKRIHWVYGLVHVGSITEGGAESVVAVVKIGDKVQVRDKSVDVEGNMVA